MSVTDGVTLANEIKKVFEGDTIVNARLVDRYKRWEYARIYRVVTTATITPAITHPDAEWINNRKQDVILKELSIIPNAAFKTKGLIQILVNDTVIMESTKAANFTDVSEYVIKLDTIVKQNYGVKILAWTSDGTSSAVTVSMKFCEG